jgi:hypothetical protein
LTERDLTGDGDKVLPLHQLIQMRRDERGWSYDQLAHRSKGKLTKSRWQQLGTQTRMKEFPELATVHLLAEVLEMDETTIVLSVATSLGIDVRFRGGPMFAQLLPAGTDLLSDRARDAVLGLIRVMVAEAAAHADDDEGAIQGSAGEPPETYRWAKTTSEPETRGGTAATGRTTGQ